jgi:hypothetical protein
MLRRSYITKKSYEWKHSVPLRRSPFKTKLKVNEDKNSLPSLEGNRGRLRKSEQSRVGHAKNSWRSMKQRCLNPRNTRYESYGGKGISICDRWLVFENFLADMGERPPGTSIDRYPNKDGNYEPGNCRWATRSEQERNKPPRYSKRIPNGPTELSERSGLPLETVRHRLRLGWSIERILSEPVRARRGPAGRLSANGRRTNDWKRVWHWLKPRLEAANRTSCEFGFILHDCWGRIDPCHSKKRRLMTGNDIYILALGCAQIHRVLDEAMSHTEMETAVLRAIHNNGGPITPEGK